MKRFTTKRGNTLEVLSWNSGKPGTRIYEFILHELKAGGEQITLLERLPLTNPDFFTNLYIEKY